MHANPIRFFLLLFLTHPTNDVKSIQLQSQMNSWHKKRLKRSRVNEKVSERERRRAPARWRNKMLHFQKITKIFCRTEQIIYLAHPWRYNRESILDSAYAFKCCSSVPWPISFLSSLKIDGDWQRTTFKLSEVLCIFLFLSVTDRKKTFKRLDLHMQEIEERPKSW